MEQKGRATSTSSSSTGSSSMPSDLRIQQQLLQSKESTAYSNWMNIFRKTHFDGSGDDSKNRNGGLEGILPMNELRHARLVYVGGRHASMLSIKLSKVLHSHQQDLFKRSTTARGSNYHSNSSGTGANVADVPALGVVMSVLQDPTAPRDDAGSHEHPQQYRMLFCGKFIIRIPMLCV